MTTTDRRLGVRSQILGWYVVVVAGVLTLSVIALRRSLEINLEERIDRSLAQEVSELRQVVPGPDAGADKASANAAAFATFMRTNVPERDEMFFTIIDGTAREVSADAPAPLHLDTTLVARLAATNDTLWLDRDTPAGPARLLAVPAVAGQSTGTVFAVARFTAAERAEVADATRQATLTAIGALLAVSGLAWLVAGRVLRPLSELARTARGTSDDHLDTRLEVRGPAEIASLIGTFNSMLDRLQRSFVTQRQFLDDASHELRTPLTVMRGHLELAATPDELADVRPLVNDEIDRMARIVDDLRVLAQSEQPDFIHLHPVDLDELIAGLHQRCAVLGGHDWRLVAAPPVVVELDDQRISQAVLNLAANAARHTPATRVIELGATVDENETRIWVRDEGEGIDQRDHARVFERFARGSTQRAPGGSGGLGLAIVATIAHAHGGAVDLASAVGKGSTFTIRLPRTWPDRVGTHDRVETRKGGAG